MKWPVELQNDWVTGYYDELMVCTIDCEPPRAKWKIDAQCYLWIRAHGEGVNEFGWDDNCRAETTGTVEMWGAFSAFTENQVIVDNYTGATNGWLKYDTVGGGVPPIKYPGGGLYKIKDTPNTNETAAGVDVAGEKLASY